jgi:hypothetical protein
MVMMMVGHKYKLGTPWGDQQEGEWEMKGYGGVKMIEV